MIHIFTVGSGNMVRAIESATLRHSDVEHVRWKNGMSASHPTMNADVVPAIGFHFGRGTQLDDFAEWCGIAGAPIVQGATGVGGRVPRAIGSPVIMAPNLALPMLTAVSLLTGFFAPLIERHGMLPQILESHPRAKRDAPSGTAIELARQFGIPKETVHSIRGIREHRSAGLPDEAEFEHYASHRVSASMPGFRVDVTLHVSSRQLYAEGAIALARWIVAHRSELENKVHRLSDLSV